MADVTFRDFAAAIMAGNLDGATGVLEQLLGLAPAPARAAAHHFAEQAAAQGPAFMGQAMGLRTAVASGSAAEIGAVLTACFALAPADVASAVARLAPQAR
jgi:hypothetical protein